MALGRFIDTYPVAGCQIRTEVKKSLQFKKASGVDGEVAQIDFKMGGNTSTLLEDDWFKLVTEVNAALAEVGD